MATHINRNGWWWDAVNEQNKFYKDGTLVLTVDDSAPYVTVANGLTVTAGGITVTAGGCYLAAGRYSETLTVTDDDSQNMTLAAADILAGINVHTTTTGGGTVTTDTAANIISGVPLSANDQCVVSYYVNDGDQVATFAGGTGVTVADTGQTVAANESALLLWRRTSGSAVTLYIFGA